MATKTATRKTATATRAEMFTYEQVQAIIAELGFIAPAKPVAKPRATAKRKPAPKPRPKATHGAQVTQAHIDEYRDLWKKRVTLRKELSLTGGFAGDKASTHKGMKAIVRKMEALTALGVNSYLVKW